MDRQTQIEISTIHRSREILGRKDYGETLAGQEYNAASLTLTLGINYKDGPLAEK